jgi:ATP-dependent exoDNAse (exonuclease V) beta subunit
VRRALLLGLTPRRMQQVARELQEQYDLLSSSSRWPVEPAPSALSLAHSLGAALVELEPLLAGGPEDGLAAVVREQQFAAGRLCDAMDEDEALVALRMVERLPTWLPGRQEDWPVVDGENACRRIKGALRSVGSEARSALAAHRSVVLSSLLEALRDLVLSDALARRRKGVATFHDLLTWARDLLRDHPLVLGRAREWWRRIFVDEFQDTDPLQAELAFFLCGDPPEPGTLCLVGDPKQSIYRFRRADIALYQTVSARAGGAEPLTQNFRSVPSILGFANHHFSRVMEEQTGVQPGYVGLAAGREDHGPALWWFGDVVDRRQSEIWELEAADVARSARLAVSSGWEVVDPVSGALRPARFSDVCVLIPSRTNLRRLERAFDACGVPYRVESGELVLATQEVRELLACLRAIDDPSDQVALVAVLRSPLFGCSDVELLRWTEEGGRFDYLRPGTGSVDRVRSALESLRDLHRRRLEMSVAALVSEVVEGRLLVPFALGQPRPRESWRRYRYVVGRARAFAGAGHHTLREFVDWMEGLDREGARDVAGAIAESDEDAVRVLTIHGAKGLEFPIVVLTGWGSTRHFQPPVVLADRTGDGAVHVGFGPREGERWETAGFSAAADRERNLEEAEALRMVYVAVTRARDHLVLSLWRGEHATDSHAAHLAESVGSVEGFTRLELGPEEEPTAAAPQTAPSEDEVAAHATDEDSWLQARRSLVAAAGGSHHETATGLAGDPGGRPAGQGKAGTAVGRAVHAVLQVVDLSTLEGLDNLAQAQAEAEHIPDQASEVARLVRAACETDPVREAVSSNRYWREVPVGGQADGRILEGIVDLLYETAEGLVVVDFKTDQVAAGEIDARMEQYRPQGEAYRQLVGQATGRPVTRTVFVFASSAQTRTCE